MNSEILDRLPPHDLDAEKAVLGSILVETSTLATIGPMLRPSDFYDPDHRRIFAHLVTLADGGRVKIDAVALQGAMGTNGRLADNDAALIAELFQGHWSATAIEHHVRTVKGHAEQRAIIHAAAEILRDAYNGTPPATLRSRLELATQRIDAGSLRYRRLTCAELDQGAYDLEYLIDGALVAGQPCGLAGGKKSMKTSLLIDLGISLAMGGCFLGKLRVNRACRVGIMTGESGLATIQETARRICKAAGYTLADIGGLVFSDQLPRFGSPDHQDAVRRFITDDELEVLAIDPAYLCMPGADANNYFIQGELLRSMGDVCADAGCMMMLAVHNKKGKADPFTPPELEDIAWAGFQEYFRQWLLLGRRERYEPGTGEHRLWLNVGGSAGHSALWAVDIAEGTRETPGGRFWSVNVMHADEARNAVEDRKETAKREKAATSLARDKQTVCDTMAKFPDGESKTVIRDTSGLHSTRFNSALSALLADGVAMPCDIIKGRRKTPIEGYRLKDETPNG